MKRAKNTSQLELIWRGDELRARAYGSHRVYRYTVTVRGQERLWEDGNFVASANYRENSEHVNQESHRP